GELASDLVDYFSEFDIILSYLYDPDDIFKTNIARCSPAQFVVGPYRPNEMEKVHATKVYLRPLERFAIFEANHLPRLSLNSQPAAVKQIALHPGSGSEKGESPAASRPLDRLQSAPDRRRSRR